MWNTEVAKMTPLGTVYAISSFKDTVGTMRVFLPKQIENA